MSAVIKQTSDWHTDLAKAIASLPGEELTWLSSQRHDALEQFVAHGFPTRKTEAWKYTPSHAITQIPPLLSQTTAMDSKQIDQWRLEGCDEIVFINGFYHAGLSSLPENKEVQVHSLAELITNQPQRIEKLFTNAKTSDAFDALNRALLRDGVVIDIANNAVIERPIHLLFITNNTAAISPLHNWIVAGENSQCTLVETYAGDHEASNLNLSHTCLRAHANSQVCYYRSQREAKQDFHVAEMRVEQERDSRVKLQSFALGGAIARLNLKIRLMEQGANCLLNGLYLTNDRQVSDHHIEVHHAVAQCHSDQLFKGVMDGQSKAVFNGRILVDKDAQKTAAYLSNRNLLISKLADVNTKPELEIYADDVKCSHGATIGQLDERSIFYLQSRGVSREHAERLLIYAFINDVVDRIELDALRKQIASLVIGRLPDSEFIRELL